MKAWEKDGPAKQVYEKYSKHQLLRDQWVTEVREAWGGSGHPGLALYPEVSQQTVSLGDCSAINFQIDDRQNSALLYLHGGSWMTPLAGKHLACAKRIAAEAKVSVFALDYRLAPEHPFPAAFEDCVQAYQALREKGYDRVLIGGDSAGGNLATAVCHYCASQGLVKPEQLILLSPMMDLFMEKYPSLVEFGVGNPVADMSVVTFQRFCYAPDQKDWLSPYASPLYGDLAQLPPLLLVVGGEDPLRDDNLAFAEACKKAGAAIELSFFERMPHSFFNHIVELPDECDKAFQAIAKFISG